MKTNYFFKVRICIFSIIILISCTKKKDAHQEVEPPKVEISKADSIVTHGGNGRMKITWLLQSDANVNSYKVLWYSNNQSGSVMNTIQRSNGRNIIHLMLNDIKEGKYLFDIYMYDKDGNSSPKSSAAGTVYGSEYQSTLVSRTYDSIKTIDNGVGLNWGPSNKGLVGVEVKYKDSNGDSVIHFVSASRTLDTLKWTSDDQFFEYRSLYLPDPTVIDTFYTDYLTAQVGSEYEYKLDYDATSNTSYYLTRIHHVDKFGELIKLRLAHTIKREGETVREFALRTNSKLAFNASTQTKFKDDKERADMPTVVAIVEGDIINNSPRDNRYTLGIEDDNELIVYSPGMTAQAILNDGVENAVTAFVPLILDHKSVSDKIINYVGNQSDKHPRQVIAQFDNLDILFLTTGGRGFGGDGMTAKDIIRILKGFDVRFAYNLDGGGSTSTVVDGKFINWKMDKHGTEERKRPTFLYVK